jgi:hypothetical protein
VAPGDLYKQVRRPTCTKLRHCGHVDFSSPNESGPAGTTDTTSQGLLALVVGLNAALHTGLSPLHGIGFAGALIDIGPPQVYFLSLLAASIGVELRQLAFLAAESAWFFVRNERSAYPAIHTISEGASRRPSIADGVTGGSADRHPSVPPAS